MGIYKRKQESKKERKHAFDQEKKMITVKKKKVNTLSAMKDSRKPDSDQEKKEMETQLRIKHLVSFFRYIQYGQIDKRQKLS